MIFLLLFLNLLEIYKKLYLIKKNDFFNSILFNSKIDILHQVCQK
jgi:hypothetical protein